MVIPCSPSLVGANTYLIEKPKLKMLEHRERRGTHEIEELLDRSLFCRVLALVDTIATPCVFVCDPFIDALF
jgi:hypothetical protein